MVYPGDESFVINIDPYGTMHYLSAGVIVDEHLDIMQYTGLKDRSGREIYEGDILKIEVSNILGDYEIWSEVAYSESKGAFHAMGTTTDHLGDFIYGVTGVNNCQVVGNTYENPELLK